MDEIHIDIHTIDWTEGEHSSLSLMLAKGKNATVAWGDGRKQSCEGRPDYLNGGLVWHRFDHYYPFKNYDYTIDIYADDDAIIGLSGMAMFEQYTTRVDLSRCPSLKVFEYSACEGIPLDVSHNPHLEKIAVREVTNERLDFSANPNLEELQISESKELISIKLSKNDRLRKLNITINPKLRRVALSNKSSLNWLSYWGTYNLNPKDKEYLMNTLERNAPYYIEDFGNDDEL